MKKTNDYRQTVRPRLLSNPSGFSLVELMVATVIVMVTLAGVTASFNNFTGHSSTSLQDSEKNAIVKATFQLLKRDLNMAGFGLALQTRMAEDDQFETAIESDFTSTYDSNTDGDSLDNITEADVTYDLNNDGDQLDPVYRDRLYLANGWTILEDITDNHAYDGNIVETPTDYYYLAANKKENGGYFARLTAPEIAGALTLTVDNLNINTGDEYPTGLPAGNVVDFKADAAVIICGQNAAATFSLEGLPVGSIAGTTIDFLGAENLANSYVVNGADMDTEVVPAITWYVEQKAGDAFHWLYRNQDKVMPGVIGFQVSYGYDNDNDGLQWFQTVPPTGPAGTFVDSLDINTNTNLPAITRALKAVRLVLTLRNISTVSSMQTYEKTIILKN